MSKKKTRVWIHLESVDFVGFMSGLAVEFCRIRKRRGIFGQPGEIDQFLLFLVRAWD
jgi:hypothetical protein